MMSFRELGDTHVVLRIPDIEDAARGTAVLVFDDAQQRVHAVVDERERPALPAAIDELDRFLEDDIRK